VAQRLPYGFVGRLENGKDIFPALQTGQEVWFHDTGQVSRVTSLKSLLEAFPAMNCCPPESKKKKRSGSDIGKIVGIVVIAATVTGAGVAGVAGYRSHLRRSHRLAARYLRGQIKTTLQPT
jgi:hypothetical protein